MSSFNLRDAGINVDYLRTPHETHHPRLDQARRRLWLARPDAKPPIRIMKPRMKLTSMAWITGFLLLMQGAYARIYIEHLDEDPDLVIPRLVGTFTIPDSGRGHGGTQAAIGELDSVFTYGSPFFTLNSAFLTGSKWGLPFRRFAASSYQPLSNVRLVEVNPKAPRIYAGTYSAGLLDSSLDTVVFSNDGVVLGRVDAADITGTTIKVNHLIVVTPEDRYKLLSVIGETLIKIAYDGGELEVVSGGVPIGHITLLQGSEASIKLKNGMVRAAKAMGALFNGDTILTGAETSLRATFADETVAHLGPNSEFEIEQIRKEGTSILSLRKGYIRIWAREANPPAGVDKIKLHAGWRHTFICHRGGASFSANVAEARGSVSVRGVVTDGVVDFIDDRTGNEVELEAGESRKEIFPSDDGDSMAKASVIPLDRLISARIFPSFDVDYFRFELPQGGEVTVESFGTLDTIGELYDSAGKLIAKNDERFWRGDGNWGIRKRLTSGIYFCEVRGEQSVVGDYGLKISYAPPDAVAPTIVVDPLPQFSNARSFTFSATFSDDRELRWVFYRNKPPGRPNFQPLWSWASLGGAQSSEWSTQLDLTKEGRWEVEIQARDAAENESKTETLVVIADWTEPTQLASVRYRLKEPKATKFGDWFTVNLRGNKLKQEWSRLLTLRKTGPWHIELQSVDTAGNASKTAVIKVNRAK